jgi:phage gp46-like protein
MDYLLTPVSGLLTMSFDHACDFRNNIMLSLHTKKGAFFLDIEFGSRLHEIKSVSDADLNIAVAYCNEALQWLIAIKKVSSFSISSERIKDGILILVNAHLSDGSFVPYEHFVRVL